MIHHLLSVGVIGGADGPTEILLGGSDAVSKALQIMVGGMLGVFVVIGLIAVIVAFLSRIGRGR